MNTLKVFAIPVFICFAVSAREDEEALVPTFADWDRARVVLERVQKSDIVAGPKDAEGRIHEALAKEIMPDQSGKKIIIDERVILWPNGRVPYVISPLFGNRSDDSAAILAQIRWFNPDRTCVEWVPRTTESDFVLFTPNGKRECSADIGKKGGVQKILLGQPACFLKDGGVIMHEMLHVLGFIHEHTRVDRDRYVKVKLDNVKRGWLRQYLRIRPSHDVYKKTKYDYASVLIMHYGPFDNAVDETWYTLEPVAGGVLEVMGQRQRPTRLDIVKLNTLYGCLCPQYDSVDCIEERPTTRQPTTPSERCILLIGGYVGTGAPLVEYYHPTSRCRHITPISTEMLEEAKHTSGCFLPDTQQIVLREAWNKPPMLYSLSYGAATTLRQPYSKYTVGSTSAMVGGRCVSCAGWTGVDGLSECYSLSASNWASLPPLPQPLYGAASATLGADYYVIGGWKCTSFTDQVYRYNTIVNKWHTETPMDDSRAWHAAAALSDTELLVCGGWGLRRDCTVFSATTQRWTRAADLNTGRDKFAMVVFNGRVYALGGEDRGAVEVYDRTADSWRVVRKRLKGRRYAFVGLVV